MKSVRFLSGMTPWWGNFGNPEGITIANLNFMADDLIRYKEEYREMGRKCDTGDYAAWVESVSDAAWGYMSLYGSIYGMDGVVIGSVKVFIEGDCDSFKKEIFIRQHEMKHISDIKTGMCIKCWDEWSEEKFTLQQGVQKNIFECKDEFVVKNIHPHYTAMYMDIPGNTTVYIIIYPKDPACIPFCYEHKREYEVSKEIIITVDNTTDNSYEEFNILYTGNGSQKHVLYDKMNPELSKEVVIPDSGFFGAEGVFIESLTDGFPDYHALVEYLRCYTNVKIGGVDLECISGDKKCIDEIFVVNTAFENGETCGRQFSTKHPDAIVNENKDKVSYKQNWEISADYKKKTYSYFKFNLLPKTKLKITLHIVK